jgi:hypothetical protein
MEYAATARKVSAAAAGAAMVASDFQPRLDRFRHILPRVE